jgi:geranylgeranyl pyrophosphate synthase
MIDKKNQYKTASYTFTRPMLTWAVLTGANEKTLNLIKNLWDCIGMAFQVRDDLKDILWTEVDKRIFSDIQEWQQTYFTNYVFKNGKLAQYKNCKIETKLINQSTNKLEKVELIPIGKTVLRQVTF